VPAAGAEVFAEGMRAMVPPATCTPAILWPGLPEASAPMGTEEGAAGLAGYGDGETKTERAKPTLPGTAESPKTVGERVGSGAGEGHP